MQTRRTQTCLRPYIQIKQNPAGAMTDDQLINEAIIQSLKDVKDKNIIMEPLNPEQRKRENGIPVGLKNLGNSTHLQFIRHRSQTI